MHKIILPLVMMSGSLVFTPTPTATATPPVTPTTISCIVATPVSPTITPTFTNLPPAVQTTIAEAQRTPLAR